MNHTTTFRLVTVCLFTGLLIGMFVLPALFKTQSVEATRIAGRETDTAFNQLASSNEQLARSNQALASSINQLASVLHGLEIKQWSKSQEELSESQAALTEAMDRLGERLAEVPAISNAPVEAATTE